MADAETAATIRVLLVDDDPLVRAGLGLMLGGAGDVEVAGEAGDGAEAVALARRLQPDAVLMDIRMPGTDGLEATAALRALQDPPEVIILTTFDTDEHVLRALRAGAAGFLLKDTRPEDIVGALRRLRAGEPVLSPGVTRRLIAHVVDDGGGDRRRRAAERLAALSDRERAVAGAIGRGEANAEIAAALYMSVPTVKTHVSRILAKLGVGNRVQIALLVNDAGEDGEGPSEG
ncbi:response regulator [Nocardiopsis coralliicola]